MSRHTFAVDVAPDGETALEQEYLNDYDLIILDVMLPRKDGIEDGVARRGGYCRSDRDHLAIGIGRTAPP